MATGAAKLWQPHAELLWYMQVYGDAAAVYAALADHLRGTASKGNYFFGPEPSSLDAALFAHLALHHSAPVSAPELRQKVVSNDILAPADPPAPAGCGCALRQVCRHAGDIQLCHHVQLREHPILVTYVEHISSKVFSAPLPAAPPITSADWAQRAENVSSSSARYKPPDGPPLVYPQCITAGEHGQMEVGYGMLLALL